MRAVCTMTHAATASGLRRDALSATRCANGTGRAPSLVAPSSGQRRHAVTTCPLPSADHAAFAVKATPPAQRAQTCAGIARAPTYAPSAALHARTHAAAARPSQQSSHTRPAMRNQREAAIASSSSLSSSSPSSGAAPARAAR